MSINHYSPDLPEAHWWSQHMVQDSPVKTSSSSSSSNKKSFTTHYVNNTTAAFWSNPHQLYHPNTAVTAMFNLNNDDEGELLDDQATTDDRQTIHSNSNSSSKKSQQDEEVEIPKEPLFEKPLTPSDVGKLNRLVIPKQHAEKYFPLNGSDSNEKGLLLSFEDEVGKSWRFRYSYWNSSQSYVLTKGWSRFVKEKRLDAGDIVLFFRHRLDPGCLFIGWRRRNSFGQDNGTGVSSDGRGGCWSSVVFSSSGQPYPVRNRGYPSLPHQPDHRVHAGSVLQNQTTAGSGNSKRRLRLFGVNLECEADEPEPPTPEGSSRQRPDHHYYPYHHY